mgnify:CR=1 FL=1
MNRNLFSSTTADGQYSLFFSAQEMSLFNDLNVELTEIVARTSLVYYSIEADLSDTNVLYGESEHKVSRNPVQVYGWIMLDEPITESGQFTLEQKRRIEVYLHKDRLTEIGLVPRIGDFINYDNQFWEILNVFVPKFVHGFYQTKLGVVIHAITTRKEVFDTSNEITEIASDSELPY